jgi:anaerobic dimethyl sulfoxide reductase subunit B (iron-sulfur subunit)
MAQMGFYFDMTRCVGCKACQIACRDRNALYDVGEMYRMVTWHEMGSYPQPSYYCLSITCNHCTTPACMAVCPVGAITKDPDSGIVTLDQSKCIGCKSCVGACPYGEPKYIDSQSVSGKCDSCKSLRDKGELPACVAACTMRALDFGDVDDLKSKYGVGGVNLVDELPILPDDSLTGPNVLINPRANSLTDSASNATDKITGLSSMNASAQ